MMHIMVYNEDKILFITEVSTAETIETCAVVMGKTQLSSTEADLGAVSLIWRFKQYK